MMQTMNNPATVGVISLGCSKNRVDTERMLGLLQQSGGFRFVSRPEDAEIIIINTCGFIEPSKQESINTILEMAAYKAAGSCKKLVVTGCLSQRYREELRQELPEVDIFLGVREYHLLPSLLQGGPASTSVQCAPIAPRVLTTPSYSAYLRIGDGCNNRCAYCAIPLIRGPLTSTPLEALWEEGERLAQDGVTELTVIAQDTSGYGVDRYNKPMLLPLLQGLCRIEKLHWVRVLYTYPDTVTPELVEGLAMEPKLCNYLDIPLQHINNQMLKAMNRRGSQQHIKQVLDWIRRNAPDFMLRTTMMVGFPGETQEQFQEMLDFLRDYPFDRVGAFAFSPEEGTVAAEMEGQVPEPVKAERLDLLMRQQAGISFQRNRARVGKVTEVLVDGIRGDTAYCRSYAEAPEVDGNVLLPFREGLQPGMYVKARLTRAQEYDIWGEEE